MEMTRVDLRNYLERIYNVPVAAVRTRVQHGSNRKRDYRNVRMKKPDYKVAYVQLIRMPSSILCPSGNRQRGSGARPLSCPDLGGLLRGTQQTERAPQSCPLLRCSRGQPGAPHTCSGVWVGAWPTLAHSELLVKDVKPVNLQSRS
nr:39S ribosomal protein L23, mitochondrial isoform X3 [Nyctereutes procyonoides]